MKPSSFMILACCATGVFRLNGAEADETTGALERGRVIFNQCLVCHGPAADAAVPNPGPDLRGVIGRPAGSVPGYRYSRALRNARLTWTELTLDAFLADPQAAVPGNTMPFPGIVEEPQRRDLITYLQSLP